MIAGTSPERQNLVQDLYTDVVNSPEPSALPQRVRHAIEKQDDASEILIRLIQLSVVILFGILYFVSRKTDAGTSFSPVPYVLTGYLALTLLGLLWSLKRRLPDWAVYGSICLDIGLLLLLIWSFHIQYNQPASFFLKAPTVLYIFIFIALRALRFQPRFVLAAGLTAALGWVAMVVYVITIDPDNTMITRNYVEYLTSNSILIGGEVDKIVAILMVTVILAFVLRRGQKLLIQAVTEHTAAKDLSRFFDESVATQIRGADHEISAGEGVKREAAVLNIDIRGFTSLAADMSPDEIMALLANYQERLVPIIQKYNGTIDKFLGDGIMATFGAVTDSDRFAADALRAVDDIVKICKDWAEERRAKGKVPLIINASVAVGDVVFGAIGDKNRLEYTVIGTAVNLSAKLEKYNKVLGVCALATHPTYVTALAQGYERSSQLRIAEGELGGLGKAQKLVVLHE